MPMFARSGAMVAFVSAAAGVGTMILCTYLGMGAGKAIGAGGMAAGALAWFLGKHDGKLHPCAIFFIPMRLFAVLTAAAGALFFVTPEKPKTEADAKSDAKLKLIIQRLGEGEGEPTQPARWVPLVLALEWAAVHADPPAPRSPGREIVARFLGELASRG